MALFLTGMLLGMLPYSRRADFGFLRLLVDRPFLALAGFSLALGAWVDKALFWTHPDALAITPLHRSYIPYDVSFFLGYASALPSLSWLLLQVETSFAGKARRIYAALGNREPYEAIHQAKLELAQDMNANFRGVMLVQGPVSLLAIYFTPQILEWLGLPGHLIHIVQFLAMAAMGVALLQAHSLYLLYFDMSREAAIMGITFLVSNVVFTLITMQLGYRTYGLGYLGATYLAGLTGAWLISRNLPRLEYFVLRYYARLTLLASLPRSPR